MTVEIIRYEKRFEHELMEIIKQRVTTGKSIRKNQTHPNIAIIESVYHVSCACRWEGLRILPFHDSPLFIYVCDLLENIEYRGHLVGEN